MRPVAIVLLAGLLWGGQGIAKTPPPLPPPGPGDFRPLDAANTLVIDTNRGRIIVELYPLVAPNAVARLETLARQHTYDGLSFFRVIDGFMDQTGDPQNTGQGSSSLPNLPAEFSFRHAPGAGVANVIAVPDGELGFVGALPVLSQPDAMAAFTVAGDVGAHGLFCTGVLGMARAQDEASANSQFFLMRGDQLDLDEKYTPVGRVIAGQSAVQAVKTGDPVTDPKDVMTTVQVLADMPPDSRPNPKVLDTSSAYFKALVARNRAITTDQFNPCAVEISVAGP